LEENIFKKTYKTLSRFIKKKIIVKIKTNSQLRTEQGFLTNKVIPSKEKYKKKVEVT